VFDGRVHSIWVMTGRFADPRGQPYSPSWHRVDMKTAWKLIERPVPRPPHLDEIIRCAEILGDGLDFVRVDLYDAGKVYFGEMTLYPSGGGELCDQNWNRHLGGLWNLSLRDKTEADVDKVGSERDGEFGAAAGL
jgi:hypothetical protein